MKIFLIIVCVVLIVLHAQSANALKLKAFNIVSPKLSWLLGTIVAEIINGFAFWYLIEQFM